jgi:hypothetical protein
VSVLVVGGDKIDNIKENLKDVGFDKIKHVSGRRKKHRQVQIPANIDLVLVLTDFIGHKVAETIKNQSKSSDVKIIYSKRSWINIEKSLKNDGWINYGKYFNIKKRR